MSSSINKLINRKINDLNMLKIVITINMFKKIAKGILLNDRLLLGILVVG